MTGFTRSPTIASALELLNAGDFPAAGRVCRRLLDADRRNHQAMVLLGQVEAHAGRIDQGIELLSRAVSLAPRNVDYHVKLGELLITAGRYDEASQRYDRALKVKAGYPAALAGKAVVHLRRREPDRAARLLAPFVEAGSENAGMAAVYAQAATRCGDLDDAIRVASRHLDDDAVWPQIQGLWFAIGAAHEKARRFDEAFDAYTRGNKVNPGTWDAAALSESCDVLMSTFDRATVESLPRPSTVSELPVLIVGMPRCGSTLTEQILDMHPQAHGAGELGDLAELVAGMAERIGSTASFPACVHDLDRADVDMLSAWYLDRLRTRAPSAARVCDKNLSNFQFLGVIAALLPGARIVHTRREPMDLCLSCYVNMFAPGTHVYASDLRSLGVFYNNYVTLMEHWREVLEIPMLELDYEQLVADPEGESRRLVEFCGLSWDDRCLRFFESRREVLTLSRDQINRPMYRSSVGRHRNYEKHLGPLREVLESGGRNTEAARGDA